MLSGSFNKAPNSVTRTIRCKVSRAVICRVGAIHSVTRRPSSSWTSIRWPAPMKAAVNDGVGLIDAFAAHEELKWSAAPAKSLLSSWAGPG